MLHRFARRTEELRALFFRHHILQGQLSPGLVFADKQRPRRVIGVGKPAAFTVDRENRVIRIAHPHAQLGLVALRFVAAGQKGFF